MKNRFKGRHFTAELILFCVRWYLKTSLSYQQVAELAIERGFPVNKTTIWRWVQHYAPLLRKKLTKHFKMTGRIHHLDETYLKIKGKPRYLYRAVDSHGNTLDFLLTAKKDKTSAMRFFNKIISNKHVRKAGIIVTEKNPTYPTSIRSLKAQRKLGIHTRHIKKKRANNILESDHRFIKRKIRYSMWFQMFNCAHRTISSYESMHMICKGPVKHVAKNDPVAQKRFVENLFGVAA